MSAYSVACVSRKETFHAFSCLLLWDTYIHDFVFFYSSSSILDHTFNEKVRTKSNTTKKHPHICTYKKMKIQLEKKKNIHICTYKKEETFF